VDHVIRRTRNHFDGTSSSKCTADILRNDRKDRLTSNVAVEQRPENSGACNTLGGKVNHRYHWLISSKSRKLNYFAAGLNFRSAIPAFILMPP
jgi:hypothetical protein